MLSLLSQDQYFEAMLEQMLDDSKTQSLTCIFCKGEGTIEVQCECCESVSDDNCDRCCNGLMDYHQVKSLKVSDLKKTIQSKRDYELIVVKDLFKMVNFCGHVTDEVRNTYHHLMGDTYAAYTHFDHNFRLNNGNKIRIGFA